MNATVWMFLVVIFVVTPIALLKWWFIGNRFTGTTAKQLYKHHTDSKAAQERMRQRPAGSPVPQPAEALPGSAQYDASIARSRAGDHQAACAHLQEAIAIRRAQLGDEHEATLTCRISMIGTLCSLKRVADANRETDEVAAILQRKTIDPKTEAIFRTQERLARHLQKLYGDI
ncbi:tetratricopeptide repeat protein [Actinoallomurus sp. NPDC050550]|uniref:tetratricopeptide repeat protein n=1 Tax=Actinoallomurus sp. NPDC050550 TaxID=3154937 RepID=UPI0033D68384